MRHHVFGNQLGRNTKQARALYRSLVAQVLEHGKIETTLAKAKAVRGQIDRLITQAKKNTPVAQRNVVKIMGGTQSLKKLFGDLAPRYTNRSSGFTRIIRLGQRLSDTTEKVILELVEGVENKIESVTGQPAVTPPALDETKTTAKETKNTVKKTQKNIKAKSK